jgi:hypothetical protein
MRLCWLALCACACGAQRTDSVDDPCAPFGHIHRDPEGAWCHCDRGHVAAAQGLSCQVDPNFTGRTNIDLAASETRACWHAANGPFSSQNSAGAIADFLTLYTVTLTSSQPQNFAASLRHRAAISAPHVLSVSQAVAVTVSEVLPSGELKRVPILSTGVATQCAQFSQQFGFELVNRGEYRFEFSSSTREQASFVLDQSE